MPKEAYKKLPPTYEETVRIIDEVVTQHDLKSFELSIRADWRSLGIAETPKFSALLKCDIPAFIKLHDEEISASIPTFSAELEMSETFKKTINFFPHIAESLMVLRDSAGYFYSLTGGGKDALLYLEKLEKRKLLLKPLCDYFDAKLDVNGENEAPSGKVNGLEFVILYNLLGNAYHHSSGRLKVADKEYASVVDFDPVSREFIVTSRSDSDVDEEFDFDIVTLTRHGHFGLFISAVYAFHSGKELRVSNALNKLFVCTIGLQGSTL
ncbi:hypothetical protein KKE48_03485 [Patescibacteria group bacterium]|nr:hypothetical protein [Patescibacteria group bacterium]MBU1499904.1 hypothetical protein [Patescibacteria group bacterium]